MKGTRVWEYKTRYLINYWYLSHIGYYTMQKLKYSMKSNGKSTCGCDQ